MDKHLVKKFISYLKSIEEVDTQKDFAIKIGYKSESSFSQALAKNPIPKELFEKINNLYPQFEDWARSKQNDDFLSHIPDPEPKENPTKEDVNRRLADIVNNNKRNNISNISPSSNDLYMMVEYEDLATAAGVLGGANADALPESKTRLVPREYDNGKYLVVRVDGHSMDDNTKKSIEHGSEILIKEYTLSNGDQLPIRNNLFVIVSREGTVFKQIIKHVPGEYIVCHSYNPDFKDFTIAMEDILQIFIYRKVISSRPEIPDIN